MQSNHGDWLSGHMYLSSRSMDFGRATSPDAHASACAPARDSRHERPRWIRQPSRSGQFMHAWCTCFSHATHAWIHARSICEHEWHIPIASPRSVMITIRVDRCLHTCNDTYTQPMRSSCRQVNESTNIHAPTVEHIHERLGLPPTQTGHASGAQPAAAAGEGAANRATW